MRRGHGRLGARGRLQDGGTARRPGRASSLGRPGATLEPRDVGQPQRDRRRVLHFAKEPGERLSCEVARFVPAQANGLKDRDNTPFGTWQFRFIDWFRDLGFLGKSGVETKAARDVARHVNPPPARGRGAGPAR